MIQNEGVIKEPLAKTLTGFNTLFDHNDMTWTTAADYVKYFYKTMTN